MLTVETLIRLLGKGVTINATSEKGVIAGFQENSAYVQVYNRKEPETYYGLKARLSWDDESLFGLAEELFEEQAVKSAAFMKALDDYNSLLKQYYTYKPSGLYDGIAGRSFIKFGGTGGEEHEIWHINAVDDEGVRRYILNSSNKPSFADGDTFYLAKSFKDGFNRAHTAIFARGTVSVPGNKITEYKEEWVRQIDWLPKHRWTVFVKDFELLRAPLGKCVFLEHLYDKCGKDVYETYYGTDKESDDLYTVHRRRPHMFLSPVGVKAINDEFEKRAVEFGVARYEKNNNIDTYDIVRVGDDLRKELGI